MRRSAAILLAACVVATGCGGGDPVAVRPPSPDDPATLACRGLLTPVRETCEGSFFQCREDVRDIVEDLDVGDAPSRERISVAYARAYWSEVDGVSRAAARRGCRGGLPR